MTGPETIWEAINGLRAERIGHGISCIGDPRLIEYLRTTGLPLEVCPTSTVRTRQVPVIAAHPLPRRLDAGICVTLNSDDLPMLGTSLTGEYRIAPEVFGLTPAAIAELARNGVRASFLDSGDKQAILAEIDDVSQP